VHTFIKSNWREVEKELDRLDNVPDKAKAALDIVLQTQFKATQAAVHVITGSLKSSGKATSETSDGQWSGTIEYGGASLGVNNPVTYAIYEQRRGTHWAGPSSVKGDHDFLAPAKALESLYVKALLKALSK